MFDEIQFPKGIVDYGTQGGPGAKTTITEVDSGQEERVGRWGSPRHRYQVNLIDRSNADIAALRTFAIARQGSLRGFRFKDHNDFTTAADGVSAAANNDVQIGVGDGTTTRFSMVKKYTSGLSTISRRIWKPVDGTTLVAVDGTPLTAGAQFTVDTTYGDIILGSAPSEGDAVTYGTEFDVPVRFGIETDEWLATVRGDVDENSVTTLGMVELLNPSPVNIDRPFFGSATKVMSGHIVVSLLEASLYVVSPQSSGLNIYLPNSANLPTGGPLWTIINDGDNPVDIVDHEDTTVATVAAGRGVDVYLSTDGDSGLVWYVF